MRNSRKMLAGFFGAVGGTLLLLNLVSLWTAGWYADWGTTFLGLALVVLGAVISPESD